MNLAEFFDMGGYALFVWPAYGLSIAAIAALVVVSWRRMKAAERLAAAGREAAGPGN